MKVSFNPYYILKPDNGRALLMDKEIYRDIPEGMDKGFEALIHPVHAMILSFFHHTDVEKGIDNAANSLGISCEAVASFVNKLIENDHAFEINVLGYTCVFPRRTLIESSKPPSARYNPQDFVYDKLDMRLKRHSSPTDITLMINTRCATDCIYCYADRRKLMDCRIPLARLEELIEEAGKFKARSFEIIGGEFFVYKHWKKVLTMLVKNGFDPYISTKIPLSENSVQFLADIGVYDIQISLDTLINKNLQKILQVNNNYSKRMMDTLDLLEMYNVPVSIHTILNKENETAEDMRSVYEFIDGKKNINSWRVELAGPTMYLGCNAFDRYRNTKTSVEEVYQFFDSIKEKDLGYKLSFGGTHPDNVNTNAVPQQKKGERPACTANYSKIFILPDGKVTICEELYWHPTFIIGDVLQNTIQEIWNSDFAAYLYKIPQAHIPGDSPCSGCSYYSSCRDQSQSCWRDIIKGYGDDKWHYPDVNCEFAPQIINHV
ncbi:radical SAM/SPASM domain-containing protein [Anditalea andensis]|uniref:Radical SAM core domain-containing protein n=1 Tax=Anditalea andensis TaxID=1048983 RepID=A0A074KSW5_9BACT|nr:radical SAM protein [Anditalea andensis]KEO73051.1 hypothetical protein EL17_15685 [Anditalea andensis]